MGLAKIQQILAQLYTNPLLRERFAAAPHTLGEELGLTSEEAKELTQLPARQIIFFASSLQGKRLHEIGKLLPLSHRVLGERFGEFFRRYAITNIPREAMQPRDDAVAFASFVKGLAHSEGGAPSWIIELLRYEKARIKAADSRCRITLLWFQYDMDKLVSSLAKPEGNPLLIQQRTVALWFHFSRRGRVKHYVLRLPHLLK
jgi:hypothetical protein